MDEKSSRHFLIYYIIVFLYAIVGLISSFYFSTSQLDNILFETIISTVWIFIFIISIHAFFKFRANKFSRLAQILPAYHVIFLISICIISGIIGFMWGFSAGLSGEVLDTSSYDAWVESAGTMTWLSYVGFISSLFELILSGFVIFKFRLKPK